MSTKSTIWFEDDIHVYEDVLDEQIHVEIRGIQSIFTFRFVQAAIDAIVAHQKKQKQIAEWKERHPGQVFMPEDAKILFDSVCATRRSR